MKAKTDQKQLPEQKPTFHLWLLCSKDSFAAVGTCMFQPWFKHILHNLHKLAMKFNL